MARFSVAPPALLGVLSLLLAGQAPSTNARPAAAMVSADLAALGIGVSRGAAPGYADERSCALCHRAIAASYAERGMARAFRRPVPSGDIEDFTAPPFVHAASAQVLQIARRGGDLVFRRWQNGPDGQAINLFEQKVDWILGSGNHARTYLYQTAGGEIYQLPLAWYSQERRWGMAPGFDRPDHEGVLRRVRRECIFCHTSYPEMPAGADSYSAPQAFPAALPEGVGCQRCHGPGAEHVWLAMGGVGVREEIRESIFNPGRLPPARRDEVCLGCHLQPAVALPGVRRFGRADFSFRSGEPLADYLVQVDVDEEGKAPGERFEINHHAYRLRQSRCSLASGGALSCLTCHDPHRVIPAPERAAHYRAACLTCHREDACTLAPGSQTAEHGVDRGDCAGCHMPKRRTQDVVHVVMTDHRIRRQAGGPDLLAPLAESEPVLTGVRLYDPAAPQGTLGEVYRAAAVVRMASTEAAVERLEKLLALASPPQLDPWLDLAQGEIRRSRFAQAERTLAGILERAADQPQAMEWLALARAGQGRTEEAIALLQRVTAGRSAPEPEYNLGRLLAVRGRTGEAALHLERALAARPNLAAAWLHLGEARAAQGRGAEGIDCFRRALAIDPAQTAAYLALGRALLARGDRAEALRWLRHGAHAAARPDLVLPVLRDAEAGRPPESRPGQ